MGGVFVVAFVGGGGAYYMKTKKEAARAEREGRYNVQAHENIPVAQAEVFEMPAQGGAGTSASTEVVETTAQASVMEMSVLATGTDVNSVAKKDQQQFMAI